MTDYPGKMTLEQLQELQGASGVGDPEELTLPEDTHDDLSAEELRRDLERERNKLPKRVLPKDALERLKEVL